MYYSKIYKSCITDGPGVRVSLYVSGCRNHCYGCHNSETWNFNYGTEFTESTEREIIDALSQSYISGFTLCGGDPCEPENARALEKLVQLVKAKFPNKTIWMYTGYSWDDIKSINLVKFIDVAVTEKFILALRDISKDNPWRGSTNQKLVNVQESLKKNKEILWDL